MNIKHTNYNTEPSISLTNVQAWQGYQSIVHELELAFGSKRILIIETFPATNKQEVIDGLASMNFTQVFDTDQAMKKGQELTDYLKDELTDDRVFGHITQKTINNLIDLPLMETMKTQIEQSSGRILLIGMGSSLFAKADLLVYADLARWEIQMRYRSKKTANYNCDNYGEDPLRMYKRAYFIEWRIADRHKRTLFNQWDFYLDTNKPGLPKMITGATFQKAMHTAVSQPFSTVPYFDPGLWGGQWMKKVCRLDPSKPNYAWSFNGVPEENSLYVDINDIRIEMPALNVVFHQPQALLGELTYARYGAEFPIRFDFLDTMEGGHLSLQVHPLTDYIQQQFGMHYTQDESYYILDAEDDATVYLGLTQDCDLDAMFTDLEKANNGEKNFDDHLFVNCFPAKKHDHFLIPAGTMHCSGKNALVLEISATPYIFTFKMWDWGRVGMDGKPRPVHLNHAKQVVVPTRRTQWVKENLVNHVEVLEDRLGYREEHTGLAPQQPIETRRVWFDQPFTIQTQGTVQVISLVEGGEAVISSPEKQFEPLTIHYAECIIIPAACQTVVVTPVGEGEFGLVRAYVRATTIGEN
jgi:mannose-6-phosphate isomerase class I